MTPAERFLAEILEEYDPVDAIALIALMKDAEVALQDIPVGTEMDVLTLRSLGELMGWGPLPDHLPGVTHIPGVYDLTLSQLRKHHMGPHEFKYHVIKWGEAEDAKHLATCERIAEKYRFQPE